MDLDGMQIQVLLAILDLEKLVIRAMRRRAIGIGSITAFL
jgi:hypothetical protein